ncbi:endonuclease/exonuclease/phosphatase family protein [Pseudomonas sp. JG-B]|nr:endonuclease/exonuclease/phosphatase family protein [Pseudomonas sp. JG-B]
MSWNIKQFNYNPQKDKSEQLARMVQIAEIVSSRNIDILTVLEVRPSVKSPIFGESYDDSQGALAIAQLKEILGEQWQYSLSGGNAYKESNKGELYAFLWRSDRAVPLSEPSLTNTNAQQKILPFKNRVPAMMLFGENGTENIVAVMVYHAPNPSEMSDKEIGYIKQLAHVQEFPTVLCGDFNMNTHDVFTILQPEFNLAVTNETSLRVKPTGTDNPYDAIFYHGLTLQSAGGDNLLTTVQNALDMTISTTQEIKSIKHYTSDHAPVWAQFSLT